MPFRDDREALQARADGLERELDLAREELARLQGASTDAAALRARVGELERERARLRSGSRARTQRWLVLFGAIAIAGTGAAAYLSVAASERQAAASLERANRELDQVRAEAEASRREADDERGKRQHAEQVQLDRDISQQTAGARPGGAFSAGLVSEVRGAAPVGRGDVCHVFAMLGDTCHVTVQCGPATLYDGAPTCTLGRGGLVVSDPIAAGRRLDLDLGAGRGTIENEEPSWTVRIALR